MSGYIIMVWAYCQGLLSLDLFLLFFSVSVGLGMLLSISSLSLEEQSFHIYPRFKQLVILLAVAVVENFGYRQIMSLVRLYGMLRGFFGGKSEWGRMRRKGAISRDELTS